MPEIADAQLATLLEAKKLLDDVASGPHGNVVKRAISEVRPDLVFPDLVAERAIQPFAAKVDEALAKFGELSARMDADAQERRTQAEADKLARAMAKARDQFGLTDAGVEGMTSLMRERGIMDPMDAAELYTARLPKPKLASTTNGRYGQSMYADVTGMAGQQERQELLLNDPMRFLDTEIAACLDEFERTGEIA